jgi:hypothetical protein
MLVLTARERGGGGRGGLPAGAPARLRAFVLGQAGARHVPPRWLVLEDAVEADRRSGSEDELSAPMDKAGGSQPVERVRRVEPTADLRDKLIDRPHALLGAEQQNEDRFLGVVVLLANRLVSLILHRN